MILHMSDFHIKQDTISDAKNILDSLAAYLTQNNYIGRIKYVVNTGDFIDQYIIAVKIIDSLRSKYADFDKTISDWEKSLEVEYPDPTVCKRKRASSYTLKCASVISGMGGDICTEYNAELSKCCKEMFEAVKEVFCDFLRKIKVDAKSVIVSCGNHDRVWLAGGNDAICDGTQLICYDRKKYGIFEQFCNDAGFIYLNSSNPIYDKDKAILFVGFDSVTPSPTTQDRYCCECLSLDKDKILLQAKNKEIITVTHKPIGDYCDNSKENYKTSRIYPFRTFLQSHAKRMLNGDKHGFSSEGNSILCGAPLNKAKLLRYSLINIDTWENIPIKYTSEKWSSDNTIESLDEIYAVSKKYIQNNLTNDFLNRDKFNTIYDLIFLPFGNISKQLSTVFRAEGEYRIKGNRDDKVDLWKETDLFEFLYYKIVGSESPNPINIRGTRGSGKSTLLIELYCNIIRKIYRGDNSIIPFYIDVISFFTAETHKEPSELVDAAIKAINDFLASANNLKTTIEKMNSDAHLLFIIDGLDELNFYGAEGEKLCNHINDICNTTDENEGKYILSINQYKKSSSIEKTEWNYNPDSDILYLDPIYLETITNDEKEKKEEFFNAINTVLNENGCHEASGYSILKAGKVTANIGLVYYLFGDKNSFMDTDVPFSEDKWYQVRRYFDIILRKMQWKRRTDADRAKLEKAAYDYIASENFDYSISSVTACSTNDFQMIIGNDSVRDMLCAQYFLRLFKEGLIADWKPFVTHELALFIYIVLSSKYRPNDPNSLRNFLNKLDENSKAIHSAQLLSILIYTLGQYGASQMEEIRRDELINALSDGAINPTLFDSHCLRRSKDIAFAYIQSAGTDRREEEINSLMMEELISEVIYQKDNRELDRVFLLEYYGDASSNYKSIDMLVKCEYSEGFDFDLAFRSLNTLLKNEKNPINLYNAFMMASFVKSRLSVKNRKNTDHLTHPFFFSEKYDKQDLDRIRAILCSTIEHAKAAYGQANKAFTDGLLREAYKASLAEMIQMFSDCNDLFCAFTLGSMSIGELQSSIATRCHPSYEFEKLKRLKFYGRSCWDYTKSPEKTAEKKEDEIIANNTSIFESPRIETVLEHIYETMLIAFLYLPENSREEKYSKKDIMSILFMHEFGVAEKGDVPKEAKKHYDETTIQDTERIAALWSNMHISSNVSHELYTMEYMYRTVKSRESINSIIAREIGWIQKEYKRRDILLCNPSKANNMKWIEPLTKASLTTGHTRYIFEILIESNPRFIS